MVSNDKQKAFIDAVNYFRDLGFYKKYQGMSQEDLAATIAKKYREEWGEELDPADPFFDICFLQFDEERVWFTDIEIDVMPGNDVYLEVFELLSDISNGYFMPEHIEEKWQSKTGPIEVSFTHKGKKRSVYPQYFEDALDVHVLKEVNAVIKDSGYAFEACTFDQDAFIVLLKHGEKEKLKKERGWEFAF